MNTPTTHCSKCNGTGRVTDHAQLGALLRRERERVGLSMRQMARRMGIRHQSLQGWESGEQPWPSSRLQQFCAELSKSTGTGWRDEPQEVPRRLSPGYPAAPEPHDPHCLGCPDCRGISRDIPAED